MNVLAADARNVCAQSRQRHFELLADGACGRLLHLAVTGHAGKLSRGGLPPDRVAAALSIQGTTMLPQMPLEVGQLHAAASSNVCFTLRGCAIALKVHAGTRARAARLPSSWLAPLPTSHLLRWQQGSLRPSRCSHLRERVRTQRSVSWADDATLGVFGQDTLPFVLQKPDSVPQHLDQRALMRL